MRNFCLLFIILALHFSCKNEKAKTEFPYSQWTLGIAGDNITWQFAEDLEYNNSFIKAPEKGEWNSWYQNILSYRVKVRSLIGKQEPYICCGYSANGETKIHFYKFSYQLKLQPGEEIELKGLTHSQSGPFTLYKPLLANDTYEQELSLKEPQKYHYKKSKKSGFTADLLEVEGGRHTFICKHIWREGLCYPNIDAKNNQDLVISFEDGPQRITHTHHETVASFSVMPSVVTNRQFAEFLQSTGYQPRFTKNFLKHWNGKVCPDSILNESVIYVSLEDARAFAEWVGMKLPTELEWQLAAEKSQQKFIFNEVFEWNDSERFDGFNRFVKLRGGCSRWITPSSWWYLPSAPFGQKAGGLQNYDSHVKYFLLYPGLDRASTIGFGFIRNNYI